MKFSKFLVASLTTITVAGCVDDNHSESSDFVGSTAGTAGAPSDRGIQPKAYVGNFVAIDDDQICYELSSNVGWGVTGEMRGFKVDPPVTTTNAAGTFTVT